MYKILPVVIAKMFICYNGLAQAEEEHTPYECGDVIHGRNFQMHYLVEECPEDILITSYITDGFEGSVVTGEIRSDRIVIEPGFSRVRILPIAEIPNTYKKHKHRTSTGGNGNTGAKNYEVYDIGISNNAENEQLVIYPNPVVDLLQIKAANNLKIIRYDLINADGKNLKQETVSATNEIAFHTTDLKEGIYFIHIQTENGEVFYKTILKH